MKALMLLVALVASLSLPVTAEARGGSHSVRGHVTKRGTYVPPHRATNPDKIKSNNWSQKGNVNPYTGKRGKKK